MNDDEVELLEEEFSDEYAGEYAWSYILKQCGHGDK